MGKIKIGKINDFKNNLKEKSEDLRESYKKNKESETYKAEKEGIKADLNTNLKKLVKIKLKTAKEMGSSQREIIRKNLPIYNQTLIKLKDLTLKRVILELKALSDEVEDKVKEVKKSKNPKKRVKSKISSNVKSKEKITKTEKKNKK